MTLTRSLPGARADFNALNLQFRHQFKAGLNLLSTYQYSKTKDNGSEDYLGWGLGNSWRDSYNTMLDYSIRAHDMPHSFVNALVYELPVGKGKKFASDLPAVANHVIGGWAVSSIITMNSGLPLFPINYNTWGNPNQNYGFQGHERPNLVGNPKPANQTPDHWINASAFERPIRTLTATRLGISMHSANPPTGTWTCHSGRPSTWRSSNSSSARNSSTRSIHRNLAAAMNGERESRGR